MDAILLAGGYATRLYPLTIDRPKALLPVGGRTILDRIMDALEPADELTRFFLVTNAKFASHFEEWAATRACEKPLVLLSDGTTANDNRLGAIGDIRFVLDNTDVDRQEGVFVTGTDNLAQFDIVEVVRLSLRRRATCIFASKVDDPVRLKRMGVVLLDEDDRVVDFEEKPQNPKSDRAVPPFYAYNHEAAGMIGEYLASDSSNDAPGHFIEWLCRRAPVYACLTNKTVLDIGTRESYEAACRQYDADN